MKKIELNSIAKINIGLNIVRKRKDGYHDLETIFYPLLLSDIMSFEKSSSRRLDTNSSKINNLDSNLVIDTIKLMENKLTGPNQKIGVTGQKVYLLYPQI